MNIKNIYNTDTFQDNFMYSLKVTGLITAATLLLALPFALFFPPAAMVVLYLGMCVCSFYFFVCVYRVAVGVPVDGTPKGEGKLTAEEWLDMKKVQDTYNDERKSKRNEDLKANAGKVVTVATPIVKYVLRIAKLTAITIVSLFVVGSVVAFAMHIIPQL